MLTDFPLPSLLLILNCGWNVDSKRERSLEMDYLEDLLKVNSWVDLRGLGQRLNLEVSRPLPALRTNIEVQPAWPVVGDAIVVYTSGSSEASSSDLHSQSRASFRQRWDVGSLSFAVFNLGGHRKNPQLNAFKNYLFNNVAQFHVGIVEYDPETVVDSSRWLTVTGVGELAFLFRLDVVAHCYKVYAFNHFDGTLRNSHKCSEILASRIVYKESVAGFHDLTLGLFHLNFATAKSHVTKFQECRSVFFDIVAELIKKGLQVLMGDANQAASVLEDELRHRGVEVRLVHSFPVFAEVSNSTNEGNDCVGIWVVTSALDGFNVVYRFPSQEVYDYKGQFLGHGAHVPVYCSLERLKRLRANESLNRRDAKKSIAVAMWALRVRMLSP